MTKSRTAAYNWSREGDHLDFDNSRLAQSTVSGRQSIGAPSVDQSIKGNYRPSVQAALEDMAQMYQTRINEIILLEEGTTPEGVSMIERLIIEGTAPALPLFVYGIPVKTSAGDNRATITQKIFDTLQTLQADNKFFKSVSKVSGVDNQIDVQFADTRPHTNFNMSLGEIVITGSTQTEAVPGYGSWTRIGSVDITNDQSQVTKAFYYKRTA
ncbi:MAG: hypothetical protein [Caudoviricetes sp.]|nr:MAG: hypothetical protein [Caudoviricetes sp.]